MISGLKTGWRGLRHLDHRGYQFVWLNFMWLVLSLPVITGPAASAALHRFTYLSFRQPTVYMDEFWQGFRENLKRGLLIGVLNIVIVVLNLFNLLYVRLESAELTVALRVIWIAIVVFWFGIQLYVFPLLNALEKPSLSGAYRNALVMLLLNPLYTLTLWVICALIAILSTLLPAGWVLITGAAFAVIGNAAVQDRLRAAGIEATPPPDPEDVDF